MQHRYQNKGQPASLQKNGEDNANDISDISSVTSQIGANVSPQIQFHNTKQIYASKKTVNLNDDPHFQDKIDQQSNVDPAAQIKKRVSETDDDNSHSKSFESRTKIDNPIEKIRQKQDDDDKTVLAANHDGPSSLIDDPNIGAQTQTQNLQMTAIRNELVFADNIEDRQRDRVTNQNDCDRQQINQSQDEEQIGGRRHSTVTLNEHRGEQFFRLNRRVQPTIHIDEIVPTEQVNVVQIQANEQQRNNDQAQSDAGQAGSQQQNEEQRVAAYGLENVQQEEMALTRSQDPSQVIQVRINAVTLLVFICIIAFTSKRMKEIKGLQFFTKSEIMGDGLINESQYKLLMNPSQVSKEWNQWQIFIHNDNDPSYMYLQMLGVEGISFYMNMTFLFLLIHLISSFISLCIDGRNCCNRRNQDFDSEVELTRCQLLEFLQHCLTFYLFVLQQVFSIDEVSNDRCRELNERSVFYQQYWRLNQLFMGMSWSIIASAVFVKVFFFALSFKKNNYTIPSGDVKEILVFGGWHLFKQWHAHTNRRQIILNDRSQKNVRRNNLHVLFNRKKQFYEREMVETPRNLREDVNGGAASSLAVSSIAIGAKKHQQTECAICFEKFQTYNTILREKELSPSKMEEQQCNDKEFEEQKIVQLDCFRHHIFHFKCINEWAEYNGSQCPICKADILKSVKR